MTKRHLALLFFFFFCCTQSALGQASSSDVLRDELSGLRTALHQSAATVEFAHRRQSFTAIQQAHLLLERFTQKYPDSLDKPSRDLKGDADDSYRVLKSLVGLLTTSIEDKRSDLSSLSAQLSQALHNLEVDSSQPKVFGYSPVLAASSETGEPLQVEVRGTALDREEVFLEVDGVRLVPMNIQVNKLNFELSPTQVLPDENKVSVKLLILTLKGKSGGVPVVGWWKKEKSSSFSLPIYLLPDNLGSYSLIITQKEKPETRVVQEPVSLWSRTSTAARRQCIRFQAPEGSKIDRSSIQWEETANENAVVEGERELTDTSFCLQVHVRGRGALGRGRLEGTISYTVYREVGGEEQAEHSSGQLKWGTPLDFTLPETTQDFSLNLSLYDGTELVVTETSESTLLQVEFQEENRQLRLIPVSVNDAMVVQ